MPLIGSLKMVNFMLYDFHLNKIKNKVPNVSENSSRLRTKKKIRKSAVQFP